MLTLSTVLELERCPHCGVNHPLLHRRADAFTTQNHKGEKRRWWGIYICNRCGGVTVAASDLESGKPADRSVIHPDNIWPKANTVSEDLPDRVREYLYQASNSLHAPAGAVMLAASAVDAMLKAKGYSDGSLFSRIEKATDDGVVTSEMSAWAHDVRLDANDQRHADISSMLPTETDARRCLDFAFALGQFLFVLPAQVARGRKGITSDHVA